jgi:hypothetical protein
MNGVKHVYGYESPYTKPETHLGSAPPRSSPASLRHVLAGALNPDAELLAAAAEFDLVGKRLRWINDAIPGPELSEACISGIATLDHHFPVPEPNCRHCALPA